MILEKIIFCGPRAISSFTSIFFCPIFIIFLYFIGPAKGIGGVPGIRPVIIAVLVYALK